MSSNSSSNSPLNLSLNQQVMLNQFMAITGCTYEQSIGLLDSSDWQYQTALSIFFDDYSMLKNQSNDFNSHQSHLTSNKSMQTSLMCPSTTLHGSNNNNTIATHPTNISSASSSSSATSLHVPCSTPVTPPNLEYLESAFSKLNNNTNNNNNSQSNSNNSSSTALAAAATTTTTTTAAATTSASPVSSSSNLVAAASTQTNINISVASSPSPRTMPMQIKSSVVKSSAGAGVGGGHGGALFNTGKTFFY